MVSFSSAVNYVTSLLNASFTYGTPDDERHPQQEIEEAVRQADWQVVCLICTAPSHPKKSLYITTVSVSDGDEQPESIAGFGSVRITKSDATVVNGIWCDFEMFNQWRQSSRFSGIEGYYSTDSTRFYFLGSSCQVDVANPTYSSSITDLRSPDEYYPVVCCYALASLYNKDGSNPSASQYYSQMGQMYAQLIFQAAGGPIPQIAAFRGGDQ